MVIRIRTLDWCDRSVPKRAPNTTMFLPTLVLDIVLQYFYICFEMTFTQVLKTEWKIAEFGFDHVFSILIWSVHRYLPTYLPIFQLSQAFILLTLILLFSPSLYSLSLCILLLSLFHSVYLLFQLRRATSLSLSLSLSLSHSVSFPFVTTIHNNYLFLSHLGKWPYQGTVPTLPLNPLCCPRKHPFLTQQTQHYMIVKKSQNLVFCVWRDLFYFVVENKYFFLCHSTSSQRWRDGTKASPIEIFKNIFFPFFKDTVF